MPTRRDRIPTPWEFVPADDELVGSGADDMAGPERAAMHVRRLRRLRPARDAGRSDVDLGPAGDHGDARQDEITYFDDELGQDGAEQDLEEDEHDLEDLLVVQHYLWSDEEE